jgi:hypothetical protein
MSNSTEQEKQGTSAEQPGSDDHHSGRDDRDAPGPPAWYQPESGQPGPRETKEKTQEETQEETQQETQQETQSKTAGRNRDVRPPVPSR